MPFIFSRRNWTLLSSFFSSVWSRSGLGSRFLATVWWRWRVFPKIFSKRFLLTFRSGKFWWRSRFFCSWRFALLTQVRIDFFFDWNLVSTKDFEDSLWIVCSNPQTAFSRVTEFCKNICLLNIEVNCKTFENSTWKNFKTAAEKFSAPATWLSTSPQAIFHAPLTAGLKHSCVWLCVFSQNWKQIKVGICSRLVKPIKQRCVTCDFSVKGDTWQNPQNPAPNTYLQLFPWTTMLQRP